ncbi:hypothetical protein Glove_116g50 [Diversispora epigaea]|uniref:Uncharacterized protein n=1 Tax=Diversispora epigaea TaxID=1348612 RepID=A0A397J5B1_9GLOM|nr:hypothetical protein Glove_116g50 [Diversispora epigaea]
MVKKTEDIKLQTQVFKNSFVHFGKVTPIETKTTRTVVTTSTLSPIVKDLNAIFWAH